MSPPTLSAALLAFLTRKQPQIFGSYGRHEYELKLVAERELDSQVGVLRLHRVIASDLLDRVMHRGACPTLCATYGTVNDLSDAQRERIGELRIDPNASVLLLRTEGDDPLFVIHDGLEFDFRPWIDRQWRDHVRALNADRGGHAHRAVQSHSAASNAELFGKQIVCLRCLRAFRFEEERKLDDNGIFVDGNHYRCCPFCSFWAFAFSPEQRFRAFFTLFGKEVDPSPWGLLQAKDPMLESYRMFCGEEVIEVERGPGSTRLLARAWHRRQEVWIEKADRRLSSAEWKHLAALVDLAPFWELSPEGGWRDMFDGYTAFVEGSRRGAYHYVRRPNPEPDADKENFLYLCCYLNELAHTGGGDDSPS